MRHAYEAYSSEYLGESGTPNTGDGESSYEARPVPVDDRSLLQDQGIHSIKATNRWISNIKSKDTRHH
eukprot:14989382-Ditylum_brightwellii.AAC.1